MELDQRETNKRGGNL